MKMTGNSSSLPSVAVCLAAHNGRQWLREQIDSILAQEGVRVTLFVSVDVSSDGTESWIDQAAQMDSRIVVLPHGRRFGGAATNFFRLIQDVNYSDFDYVSLSDQDDIWFADKLIRAHQMLEKTKADAYSSNVLAFWPDRPRILIEKSQPQQRWDFLFEAAGPGCTYVLRKNLVCAIQKLLKNRWEEVQQLGLHDWFFYAFARSNGYAWVIDENAKMLYRQHEKNQVGVNRGWAALVVRMHKILSGWGLNQAIHIAQLVGLGSDPFVTKWVNKNRKGLLWLALHSFQCRRRTRDQFIFFLSCIVLLVKGRSN